MRRWPCSIFSPQVLHVDLPEAANSAMCVYPDATSLLGSLEPMGTSSMRTEIDLVACPSSMFSRVCAAGCANLLSSKGLLSVGLRSAVSVTSKLPFTRALTVSAIVAARCCLHTFASIRACSTATAAFVSTSFSRSTRASMSMRSSRVTTTPPCLQQRTPCARSGAMRNFASCMRMRPAGSGKAITSMMEPSPCHKTSMSVCSKLSGQ